MEQIARLTQFSKVRCVNEHDGEAHEPMLLLHCFQTDRYFCNLSAECCDWLLGIEFP